MIRTQIQLTDEQITGLRRAAAARGVSLAAMIREAVDQLLAAGDARRDRAIRSIGGFHSGRPDIGSDHDRYLAEELGR